MASGARLSGKVRSMAGVTEPEATSSASRAMSLPRSLLAQMVSRCPTNGEMVTEGDVIVVGDVFDADVPTPVVGYEVLCRQHHRRRMTAARAHAVSLAPEPLPFGD